ncbi:YiiX/YebB-like N1pC/P60 family cysteine hydrolase [Bacteroides sp. 51]|uniref:YiiX/YebB-like N1pC/P60 family cysteine hydrolase n=1 Tax=Bacteroides sp. 51 TaxID=2302938 RepID=UPI0013D11384|nr:YiiX/YebB-like N1pC/P60 family cysteine hydrolase [Bacteroides sp. 51]NDV81367.1 hypothetical protein [Bacteroides sp. 51]
MLLKLQVSLLILFLLPLSGCKKEKDTSISTGFLYDSLRDGDLVFRRGTGIVSQAVLAVDKDGGYSHIGIVVKEGNTWKVVHAVPGEPDFKGDPDRIKMEDIAFFFSKERAKTGALMRPSVDSALCYQAAHHAVRLYQSHILFDHQYNLNDTSQMYCTELIDYVYKQQGIDLSEGRISRVNIPGMSGDYLLPSDILQSQNLCMIYYF